MPKSEVYTTVGGQRLKLTNLDKVLFPTAGITKAEVVKYYLEVAELMLKFIDRRPLTLIRYPDGIDKEGFYAKSKPTWTPDWIESYEMAHSKETISYLLAHQPADIVWCANLGGLEIHPMQFSTQQLRPDHFIFDLDPPPDFEWQQLVELALKLRLFLEEQGYVSYIKTSGSKGLHIYVPLVPQYDQEEMVKLVKKLASAFVELNSKQATMILNKERRKGKLLIDIFRNHRGHTTVAPYSMRGKPGGPISMPFKWTDISLLRSSQHFTIRNYREYIESSKEAWSDFFEQRVLLDEEKTDNEVAQDGKATSLEVYNKKRNFGKTREPKGTVRVDSKNRFVVQLHNASRLHYDLRLEQNGVLWSWAIPKGLPFIKGVKRLAIRTEDHPVAYLQFEGAIPKGEYGAGNMWIYVSGFYEVLKKEEGKIKFKITSPDFNWQYSLYQTDGDQWLIERMDKEVETLGFVPPMLVQSSQEILPSADYHYEVKWDGIRVMVVLNNGILQIFSRSGREITRQFPEIKADDLKVSSGLFDGELIRMDEEGRPIFSEVISRLHQAGDQNISRLSSTKPAHLYLFDCCNLEGKDISKEPIERRRAWLEVLIKKGGHIRFSESVADGAALFEAAKGMHLEGVMAKRKKSFYQSGVRSKEWLKIKVRKTEDCVIIGYTKGQGDRASLFGSLHLAKKNGDHYQYMGRVGTGFDSATMKELLKKFEKLEIKDQYIDAKVERANETTWIAPELYCEIQYASLASTGHFREPVFVRLKEDM